MRSIITKTDNMTDRQINDRMKSITGTQIEYAADYQAVLGAIAKLGCDVELDPSGLRGNEPAHVVRVGFAGITMAGRSNSVARAACEAVIKLNDFFVLSEHAVQNEGLNMGVRSAPFAMALTWLCAGRPVRRSAWNEACHVRMLSGTTSPALVGLPIDGVPAAFFQSAKSSELTTMPRIQRFDYEQQCVNDWAPTAIDLLAHDWMVL